mmetsp:Transcript_98392/g.276758  ORF Transcript_98392/g.276758 Transcript_98392/m.276758 type:complete len:82 (-) Transcript_98392:261-506(-)
MPLPRMGRWRPPASRHTLQHESAAAWTLLRKQLQDLAEVRAVTAEIGSATATQHLQSEVMKMRNQCAFASFGVTLGGAVAS